MGMVIFSTWRPPRVNDRGNHAGLAAPVLHARPRSSLTQLTGRQYPRATAMCGGSCPSASAQCNREWIQPSAHRRRSLLNYPVPRRRLRGHDRANLAVRVLLIDSHRPQPDARQCLSAASSAATISRRDRAPTPAAHRHAPGRAVADHRTGGPVRAQRAHAVSPVRGLHRPRAYLQQAPVEQAKRLLETASDQIDQVRRGVGYSDPAAFRRVFKQATGLPPRATAMPWTSQPLGQLNAGTSRQLSLTLPLPDNSPAIPSAGRLPTS